MSTRKVYGNKKVGEYVSPILHIRVHRCQAVEPERAVTHMGQNKAAVRDLYEGARRSAFLTQMRESIMRERDVSRVGTSRRRIGKKEDHVSWEGGSL